MDATDAIIVTTTALNDHSNFTRMRQAERLTAHKRKEGYKIMNNSKLIADALQSGARASGYNMKSANDHLKEYAPDKRYKLFAVCGTSAWAYNEHGKLKYAGQEYEYQQTEAGYIVKPATW